ncbi:NADPH-dependent FMN reductase [Hutsoniella sourekii]|uniref:NADPH-dependent FMN reductase n=1 Tax=Hutsoniella sourekii TaxID=87650 RepID=UPI0004B5B4AD|nr:NADPH-dependent FMN reductase [Hutsoniella sourekii]
MTKIICLVGTNSDHSTNRTLLQYIQKHFQEDAEIELAEIKEFPLFNKPEDKQVPDCVQEVAAKIEAADGLIIGAPEYDHSVTAALSNALHWLSYGITPLVGKPIMITGASYGILGSSRAQQHLRQILDSPDIRGFVMPNSEFLLSHSLQAFDEEGNLTNNETIEKLEDIFYDFLDFITISKQLKRSHKRNKKEAADFEWDDEGQDQAIETAIQDQEEQAQEAAKHAE